MPIGAPKLGTVVERAAETTTPVPYPAGVAAGDLLVIAGSTNAGAVLPTALAGWTTVILSAGDDGVGGASSNNLYVAGKFADAGDISASSSAGTLSVTHGNTVSIWQLIAIPGVDQAIPLDNVTPTVFKPLTASNTATLPGFTTQRHNDIILYAGALSGSAATATPPAGFTETMDRSTGTRCATMGYKLNQPWDLAPMPDQSLVYSGSGRHIATMFALRAADSKPVTHRIWKGGKWVAGTPQRRTSAGSWAP